MPEDSLTTEEVSSDFVKMLKSVDKFLSDEIKVESVRTRKQNVDILTENYYKLKLSNILFEEYGIIGCFIIPICRILSN